ncbi:MAG: hypothetical protein AB8F78_14785 [Saprospiraceae bacterium]
MKWKPALLIGGFVSFGACSLDAPTDGPKLPSEHGRWAVEEAMRNGRKTNTLDAAFFEFDTTSQIIETNFTGESLKLGYSYENGVINLRGSVLLDSFVVDEASDSTLHLSTVIRGTPFFFKLRPDDQPKQLPMRESEVELQDEE